MDQENIRKDAQEMANQVELLEKLGVASEEDMERVKSVWLVEKAQKEDRKGLKKTLGELMGALERRSDLVEQIRTKHREFSQLKVLKQKFDNFGQKVRQKTGGNSQSVCLKSKSKSPTEEVEGLEQKEKEAHAQKKRLRKKLVSIRRRLVALANNNQDLYEEMESAERLSFKLFYFLLSHGENTRVTPVIDKSLMQNTLRRAQEIDAVFRARTHFQSVAQQTSAKAKTLANVECAGVLETVWDKTLHHEKDPFSLFEEFKVKGPD